MVLLFYSRFSRASADFFNFISQTLSLSKSSSSSGAGGTGSGCAKPACPKQLETVDDVTQFKAWLSKWRASSTLMFGVSSLSIDLMNLRRTRFR